MLNLIFDINIYNISFGIFMRLDIIEFLGYVYNNEWTYVEF